jgi:hypothetical protein
MPLTRNGSFERVPHPPKPRLTLRVAVVGHRPKPKKFPKASFDFVKQRLDDVFKTIDATLKKFLEKNSKYYAMDPHKVRLVSGLAEGADQLAIVMCPDEWDVDAILPFPVERYRLDFKRSGTANTLKQFDRSLRSATNILQLPEDEHSYLPSGPGNDRGNFNLPNPRGQDYARHIDFFIRQFDILVAVWDGKAADGPGGTAEIIRLAIDANVAVVWISSQVDSFPRLVDEIEEDGQPLGPPADCLRGSLQEAIASIVSVPIDHQHSELEHEASNLTTQRQLDLFFKETWPSRITPVTYDRFKRWMQGQPQRSYIVPDSIETLRLAWTEFIEEGPPVGNLKNVLLDVLLPRYAWADALAIDLSNRFRSTYIRAYLASAIAVLIALFGFVAHDVLFGVDTGNSRSFLPDLVIKGLLIGIEFSFIFYIVVIVRRGRRARWQERWIEYRTLAENLRDLRFLSYFGEYGYVQRVEDSGTSPSAWFLWYLRATIRELGIPSAVLDGAYQRTHLAAVEKNVVLDQMNYHEENSTILLRMHRLLYNIGEYCFLTTLVMLFLYLIIHFGILFDFYWNSIPIMTNKFATSDIAKQQGIFLNKLEDWVIFLVAGLPAISAAMAGIRETGDFEGSAQRSTKTLLELREIIHEFDSAKRKLRLSSTGGVLLSTARVLTADLAAWQTIYGRKRLNLPT